MTAAFVLDCSVSMAWLFKDETTPQTTELLERLGSESAIVPALWYIELTNVMAVAERNRRITPAESEAFIANLSKFEINVDMEAATRSFTHLLPICRSQKLTSYDAVYLELAIRRQLPLATLDKPLRVAAKAAGLKLLGV